MNYSLGRYVYGVAAIGSGICALVWHRFDVLGNVPHREILSYIVAGIEILAGLAVLWRGTARAGAVAVGAIYFAFALLGVPLIIKHPLVYNNFGNFFEQFSYVSGALILYGCSGQIARARTARLAQIGYYSFGYLCCLVRTGTAFLPIRDSQSGSEMDSAWTNVLGDCNHSRVCSCRSRSAHGVHGPARRSIDHGDAGGFWVAGMAAGALCQSP